MEPITCESSFKEDTSLGITGSLCLRLLCNFDDDESVLVIFISVSIRYLFQLAQLFLAAKLLLSVKSQWQHEIRKI